MLVRARSTSPLWVAENLPRRAVGVDQGFLQRPTAVLVGDDLDAPGSGEADLLQRGEEALDVEGSRPAEHPVVDGVVEEVGGLWCGGVVELDHEHLVAGDLGE